MLEHDRSLREALASAAMIAREQRAIADIARRALRGNVADILSDATRVACELLSGHCSWIVTPRDGTTALSVLAYTGPGATDHVVAAENRSAMGYALDLDTVVLCPDYTVETRFPVTYLLDQGLRSGVCVPIAGDLAAGDTAPWGLLVVNGTTPREYTADEVTFLRTLSDVVSAAVHREQLEHRLRHTGMHDALTGLPNRTLVHEDLALALGRAESAGHAVAVFLVDFDNFKSINDHFGHDIGDVALVAVARRLRDAIAGRVGATGDRSGTGAGNTDTVARLGGDEFLLVCENVPDAAAAAVIAESIEAALRRPLSIEGRKVPLSASVGIALSEPDVGVSALVHRADVAMYRAKAGSPGRFAVYDADDGRQTRHHLTMSTDLRAAIEDGVLTMTYEPMVDARTGAIAMLRATPEWNHPALGTLSAREFVTTAERTGLIDALGEWILRAACRDGARWSTIGDPLRPAEQVMIRVDVVATQIRGPGFVDGVRSALDDAGLAPHELVVSVPESALDAADDDIRSVLAGLHRLGVRLLLDNSTGGHSSIRNLQHFSEFEFFQLDSGDVDATFREHSAVVLQAVVALIHAIGAKVIAGAVASEEHLAGVTAVGCDIAFGSYSGPPVGPSDVVAMLTRDMARFR